MVRFDSSDQAKRAAGWAAMERGESRIVEARRLDGAEAGTLCEGAAADFRFALDVFERYRVDVACAQARYGLGAALKQYGDKTGDARHLGEARDQLSRALAYYGQEQDRQKCADIQFGLGEILNDLDENEKSVEHLESALTFFTEDGNPEFWAKAHSLIGQALSRGIAAGRIPATLLDRGISSCRAALRVLDEHALPRYWALTENALAFLLVTKATAVPESGRAELFEEAATAARASLRVWTTSPDVDGRLSAQELLAACLMMRCGGQNGAAELADYDELLGLTQAIAQHHVREHAPERWFSAQVGLGRAHELRAAAGAPFDTRGELERSAACYADALGALKAGTQHHTVVASMLKAVRDRLAAMA